MPASTAVEQTLALNKSGLNTTHSLLNLSLSSLEKLVAHNLTTLRDAIKDQVDSSHSLLEARNLSEAIAQQLPFSRIRVEKSIAYFRGLHDISSATHEDFVTHVEAQYADFNRGLSTLLDRVAQSGNNSEVAVAAVKSALNAANSAFENANKAARQVADITGAGVTAASQATVRAVAAASPAKKKAA